MRGSAALGIASILMIPAVLIQAPVSADCQGGAVWPPLDRVRGTTFMGVFEDATRDEDGRTIFHWNVEHVYSGRLNPGPLDGWGIGDGCHATKYRKGRRYLVSSRFPGGADAFDTVAYEILGGGHVRLAPYLPEQPRSSAPRRYHVHTLRAALRLLVPERSAEPSTSAPRPSPTFAPSSEGGGEDDPLSLATATDQAQSTSPDAVESPPPGCGELAEITDTDRPFVRVEDMLTGIAYGAIRDDRIAATTAEAQDRGFVAALPRDDKGLGSVYRTLNGGGEMVTYLSRTPLGPHDTLVDLLRDGGVLILERKGGGGEVVASAKHTYGKAAALVQIGPYEGVLAHGDEMASGLRAFGLWWSDGRTDWSMRSGLADPRDTVELARSMVCPMSDVDTTPPSSEEP